MMRYRQFGKTQLQMSAISCGGMRFQQSWNGEEPITAESQQNVIACVRHALELGINHFETARGYGTSELQLGKVIPHMPRDKVILQTKVAPDAAVAKFVANFEKSMKLLQVDYLNLFAFHGLNDATCIENALRCMPTVHQWQQQGRIRHIGFSTHGPLDVIMKAIRTGAFEYVNLHWYYIFQDNWPAIIEARKRDMGVYIISPNEKGGLLFKPSEKLCALTKPLHPMVFNDLFCLARPEAHSLSCGVTRPQDFDLHMQAIDKLDNAGELTTPIEDSLYQEMVRVLGRRWTETWRTGIPEWHETPGGINIPWILRLRNLALAFDMIEFGKMRYNLLGQGGHWFPGNRADKLDEVDLDPVLTDCPNADKIRPALAEAHALLGGEPKQRLQQDEG